MNTIVQALNFSHKFRLQFQEFYSKHEQEIKKKFAKENATPYSFLIELDDLFFKLMVTKKYIKPVQFRQTLPKRYSSGNDQQDVGEFLNHLLDQIESEI